MKVRFYDVEDFVNEALLEDVATVRVQPLFSRRVNRDGIMIIQGRIVVTAKNKSEIYVYEELVGAFPDVDDEGLKLLETNLKDRAEKIEKKLLEKGFTVLRGVWEN